MSARNGFSRFRGDVLITHPRNVQTGLDLIQFPEVVWYQQDYSVYIVRQASRRSWRIGQKEPVNVHHLYYKGTIQEKAITLNVKKLRAALLTEGELTDGQFLEQIEEDGLVALAKTIIDRAEEKISLESELRRLRGVEEETDMILPGNLEPEEVVDEDLLETANESMQPRVMSEESQVDRTKEVVVPTESQAGTDAEKKRHPIPKPDSASLVCLRILKCNPQFIFSFLSAQADKTARPFRHTRVVVRREESDKGLCPSTSFR